MSQAAHALPPDRRAHRGSAARPFAQAEAEFFRLLNALVEPAVMAGCGSPGLLPTGFVVVETIGEKSGQPRRVPLLATVLDGCVFVSTLRGPHSQWVRNLQAVPDVRYWLGGRERRGRARLFVPGAPRPATLELPAMARFVADGMLPPALAFGWTFAIIAPD